MLNRPYHTQTAPCGSKATRKTKLVHHEPDDYVVSWRVDLVGHSADGLQQYSVGRILADELRRYEITELAKRRPIP